jgi:translocation protein SEC63
LLTVISRVDSLAGQMNALKSGGIGGAPVRKSKKAKEETSDDESDTDGDEETSETDTDTDTDEE